MISSVWRVARTFSWPALAWSEWPWVIKARGTGRFEKLEADTVILALGQRADTDFLRAIPGIENPLPDGKQATEVAATTDDNPLPALVRPRSLSTDVTKLLKNVARELNAARPLKADGRVAALEGALDAAPAKLTE